MTTHTVESTPDTVRSGYLDPAAKPAAVIAPGDVVSYPHNSMPPKAVHAVIPKDVFPADIRDRVAAWLRPGQARP
jgi:hypothetical protein